MVAEGWALFDEALSDTAPGELPQLMRRLQQHLGTPSGTPAGTPAPALPPTPKIKTEPEEVEGEQVIDAPALAPPAPTPPAPAPSPSGSTEGGRDVTTPIPFKTRNEEGRETFHYWCPQCDHIRGTRRGMDSHIRSTHTLTPFLCSFCDFSTYNLDSLARHEKTHK